MKTLKSYLEAMPEAMAKNKEFFDLLVKQCYNVEQVGVDEPLTPERLQADAQYVSQNITEYYGLIKEMLEARTR